MGSEEINKLSNYAVTTKDAEELVKLVTRLMDEYNKRISQINKYYAIYYGQQIQSIPSTSSILSQAVSNLPTWSKILKEISISFLFPLC